MTDLVDQETKLTNELFVYGLLMSHRRASLRGGGVRNFCNIQLVRGLHEMSTLVVHYLAVSFAANFLNTFFMFEKNVRLVIC